MSNNNNKNNGNKGSVQKGSKTYSNIGESQKQQESLRKGAEIPNRPPKNKK